MRRRSALLAVALTAGACTGERPVLTGDPIPVDAASTPTETTVGETTTTTVGPEPSPATTAEGRAYPIVARDPAELGARLAEVEQLLRATDPTATEFADLAHEQQLIYRSLGRHPDWLPISLAAIPPPLVATVQAHVAARSAVGKISHADPPANVPAWEIVEPLPAAELRAIYDDAAAVTGIDWAYLAAVNLLETGYGRIDGLSTAGAQGPMQFLPTTWEEVGEGSIDDPHDAIPAAARYLVRRGGPADMEAALWGYNNSDAYVEAVSTYADLFRTDEAVFVQTHAWEIHYSAAIGDLWLPVGYRRAQAVPAEDHITEAPWSAPPALAAEISGGEDEEPSRSRPGG